MTVERALRLMAGFFVLASLGLGYYVSPYGFGALSLQPAMQYGSFSIPFDHRLHC